jgi:hypothetical protein
VPGLCAYIQHPSGHTTHAHACTRRFDAAEDVGGSQRCQWEQAERHAAGRARRAHRPRRAVRPPLPQSLAAGKARRGRAPAESVRSRARAVLRSWLGSNGLTGTIGGWIGSLAKLTLLYARARACTGGTPAAAHAHSCGGVLLGVPGYSAVWGLRCDLRGARAYVCVCVCVFMCVCLRVCVCACVCVCVESTAHMRIHAMRLHACTHMAMCVRVPARARLRGMTGAGYMKGYIRVCGACCSIVCLSNIYLSRSVRYNVHFTPNGSYQLPEIDQIRAFARADTALTRTRARRHTQPARHSGYAQRLCACVRVGVRARVRKRVCACAHTHA